MTSKAKFALFGAACSAALLPFYSLNALELDQYYYPEPDLADEAEKKACDQIQVALAANQNVNPISDLQDRCLDALLYAAEPCRRVWDWRRDDSTCLKNQSFLIKKTTDSSWVNCVPGKFKTATSSGYAYEAEAFNCGSKFYLDAAPGFKDTVIKAASNPGILKGWRTNFTATNSQGESDEYWPVHTYVKELVVSRVPIKKKENLTTNYYFPVEIVSLSKYQPEDYSSMLYVKRSASFLVKLGSSRKSLQG